MIKGGGLVLGLVLIDTWWNVNVLRDLACLTISNVLIDTWWNVNLYKV